VPAQEQRAQRGRRGHCDQERREHGEYECERERPYEVTLHARGEYLRQKHRDDDDRRVYHGSPHFERCLPDDVEPRQRLRQELVLAKAPHDVFDADDRIVHEHAKRDSKSPERHGIESESHAVEDCDCREQGQRYGGERDQCRTEVAEEHVQHGKNEHARDHQRLLEIPECSLDEIGRTVQSGIKGDTPCVQCWPQAVQRPLDGERGREGVCAVLAREREENARLSHDEGVARAQGRRHLDLGHLAQPDGDVIAHRDDRLAERLGIRLRDRRFQEHTLAGDVDKPGASQRQCRFGGVGYVGERNAETRQSAHVRLDLNLTNIAAEHDDVRHAGYGQEARLDDPVGRIAQRIGIDLVG
jgi:hypothetical protein